MTTPDFRQHNDEVRRVWAAYWGGRPLRVPVGNFTIGPRIWLLDATLNTTGIPWRQFTEDPAVMWDVQLRYQHYHRHHVVYDHEMGIPDGAWDTFVEFVNVTEEAWLGCDIIYPDRQVPSTTPRYAGDRKREILDRGVPDPFSGIYATVRHHYEYFLERARHEEFCGRPVKVAPPSTGLGTDGPLTVAIGLRGEEVLLDMLDDEPYFNDLMGLILRATVTKVRAWRDYLGLPPRPETGWFADDAIELLSAEQYAQHILPWHRRLLAELYGAGPFAMHLCGDVQRHLPLIARELNVNHFDTGYPIDFATLRAQLGEAVHIQGGVRVATLLSGSGIFMVISRGADHGDSAPLLSVAMAVILYLPALLQL